MKRNPYLRVKIKSLADEARTIRQEERKANAEGLYHTQNALHEHRVGKLRRAARETLLAYQCLRGIPYAVVEKPNSKPVDTKAVERMVKEYGEYPINVTDWFAGKINNPELSKSITDSPR